MGLAFGFCYYILKVIDEKLISCLEVIYLTSEVTGLPYTLILCISYCVLLRTAHLFPDALDLSGVKC